jgi:hypothetical protein
MSGNESILNRNVENIFMRNAILAVLDLFNRNVNIEQYYKDKATEFAIPVFYHFGSDEGFLKDFFINLPDGCKIPVAEGDYEILPKGTLIWKGYNIKTSDITNKFVRGTYRREERNENDQKVLNAYSARLFSLPMLLDFQLDFEAKSANHLMKIMDAMNDEFYKNNVVYFQYRGTRIPGQLFFPDTTQMEKPTSFDFTQKDIGKLSYQIQMETYFPSFEKSSEFHRGNVIRQWKSRLRSKYDPGQTFDQSFTDEDYPPTE